VRQVTVSTLVLNLSVAGRRSGDSAAARRCLHAAAQLTQTQTDGEAHFRLLVAIGTALSPPAAAADGHDDDDGGRESVVDLDVDLENFLRWCGADGADKTRECSQLIAQLLPAAAAAAAAADL